MTMLCFGTSVMFVVAMSSKVGMLLWWYRSSFLSVGSFSHSATTCALIPVFLIASCSARMVLPVPLYIQNIRI